MKKHGFSTRAIRAGQDPEKWDAKQVVPPISLSTTFKQDSPLALSGYEYVRHGNPTQDALQENLATLENAKYARVFASGIATVMSVTNILCTGDHLICGADVYGGVKAYLTEIAVKKHGLSVDFVDLTNLENLKKALKPATKMVWFETPTNPLLKLVDIVETVKIVKGFNKEILVTVDNTFMSPFFQNPLDLGVDIVIHSLTKYINGHSDVLMGAAMTNSKEIDDQLGHMQIVLGAVASPFDCYLVIRGIKTLRVRMEKHYKNALAVAEWLEKQPEVEKVVYPALPSHPQHELHKKQTTGMSGMLGLYLHGGLEAATTFLMSLKVFTLAVSLGGYDSLMVLPAAMIYNMVPKADREAMGITDGFIRVSVGCEDAEDLIADLDQALKSIVARGVDKVDLH